MDLHQILTTKIYPPNGDFVVPSLILRANNTENQWLEDDLSLFGMPYFFGAFAVSFRDGNDFPHRKEQQHINNKTNRSND